MKRIAIIFILIAILFIPPRIRITTKIKTTAICQKEVNFKYEREKHCVGNRWI